jgi:hypothetical protein
MLEDAAQTSLRDDLDLAVEAVQPEAAGEAREEPPRNERGQFAPKTDAAPAPETPALDTPEPEAVEPPRSRPTSWKKDYWEKFDALPEDVAKYILEREEQFKNGVSGYKQQAEALMPLYEAVAPFQQAIAQYGIQPQDAVRQLLNTHVTLLNANPEQKAQHFQQLAKFYGVTLSGDGQAQADPVTHQLWQEVQQLRGRWQQFETEAQRAQAAQAWNQVESFGQGKQHFAEVRATMADLIENGLASTLEEAYDKASRLNDEVWQKRLAEQQAPARQQAVQQSVARAKAAAVQPKSGSPTAATSVNRGESLGAALSQAWDMHAGKI